MIAVNNMKLQNTKHNITKDGFLLKMDRLDKSHDSGPTESWKGTLPFEFNSSVPFAFNLSTCKHYV